MPAPLLDPDRAEDPHIAARLTTEPIIWLGTTRPDGRPHQVPVWFVWEDPYALVFSPRGAQKVRNLRANSAVAVSLEAEGGADVVLAEGVADLPSSEPAALSLAFAAKYAQLMRDGFDAWSAGFPQPILVTATRIIAWRRTPEGLRYRVVTAGDG